MKAFKETIDGSDAIDEAIVKAEAAIDEIKDVVTAVDAIVTGLQPVPADRYMDKFFPLTSLDAGEEQFIWDAMSQLCTGNDEGDVFELFIKSSLEGEEIKLNSRVQIQRFLAKLFSANVNHQVNWMSDNGKTYSAE